MDWHIAQEKNFLPAQNVMNYLAGNSFLGLRTKKNQDILSLILILNNQLEEYWAWSSYWLRHGQNVDIYINFQVNINKYIDFDIEIVLNTDKIDLDIEIE